MKDPKRRVVLTGMGILAPNGNSLDSFWHNTLRCVSGTGSVTRFDAEHYRVKLAAEVKGFQLADYLPSDLHVKTKRLGMHTQFAIAATHMAIRHSGLGAEDFRKAEPVIVNLGVSTSAIDVIEKGKEVLMDRGPGRVSPYIVSACQPHAVACEIVKTLGIRTRRSTFSSACPAGMESVAHSMTSIRNGESELVLCGGVDSPITPLTVASFQLAGMIQTSRFPPEACSRPFDAERTGGIIAEGAGMFVLESLEHALVRGATPLAELVGYGTYADDIGAEAGEGLVHSMRDALDQSGLLPEDIDYVNAHGPSDPVIDRMETRAIKTVFGDRAYRLPISSIKGVTGNPLAAAGPFQMAACAMAFGTDTLPPTAHYEFPDPDCDLNYIPNRPLKRRVRRALVNLHGLGGGNSTMILQRVEPR